jgi:predicted transcriptional regulator
MSNVPAEHNHIEDKEYLRNLEKLADARTEQLRQAYNQIEELKEKIKALEGHNQSAKS